MAAARLFHGCFAPPLRAVGAFMGAEDGASLRYVCASSRELLPLPTLMPWAEEGALRGTLCPEAAHELSLALPRFLPCLIATLVGVPAAHAGKGGRGGGAREEEDRAEGEEEEEETEADAGAARLLAWFLSERRRHATRLVALLGLGEGNVYAMMRCGRYRRRVCRLARAGVLHARDPARFPLLLCRALQQHVATLDYMEAWREAVAEARRRRPLTVGLGGAPSTAAVAGGETLSPAERTYLEHNLVYPPPRSLRDVARAAADLAELAAHLGAPGARSRKIQERFAQNYFRESPKMIPIG